MNASSWSLLALFLAVLLVTAWPLGVWLARIYSGQLPGWMHKLEAPLYRLAGTSADTSMFLIPLALKGVKYRAVGAATLLRRNLLIYGLGGLVVPFIGIKAIDLLLVAMPGGC